MGPLTRAVPTRQPSLQERRRIATTTGTGAAPTATSAVVLVDEHGMPLALELGGELAAVGRRPMSVMPGEQVSAVALRAAGRPAAERLHPLVCCDDLGRATGVIEVDHLMQALARGDQAPPEAWATDDLSGHVGRRTTPDGRYAVVGPAAAREGTDAIRDRVLHALVDLGHDDRAARSAGASIYDAIDAVVDVGRAVEKLEIHRRIAADTGLSGLPLSRGRVRGACERVVHDLHSTLGPGTTAERHWAAAVADRASDVVAEASGDAGDGPGAAVARLSLALSMAFGPHRTSDEGPTGPIAAAVGAAMAVWVLAGAEYDAG